MNRYVCFYAGKRWECNASSMFDAKEKAVAHFKPPKSKQHMVSAVLAEKDGKQVEHSGLCCDDSILCVLPRTCNLPVLAG